MGSALVLALGLITAWANAAERPVRLALPTHNPSVIATYQSYLDQQAGLPDGVVAELLPIQAAEQPASDVMVRALSWGNPSMDLYILSVSRLKEYASLGLLASIEPARAELEGMPAAVLDDASVDGQLYGVPASLGLNLLYYNAALLEAQGVEVPGTLGALVEAARQLEARGAVQQGLLVGEDQLAGFLAAAGGSPYDPTSDARAHAEVMALLAGISEPDRPVHRRDHMRARAADSPGTKRSILADFQAHQIAFFAGGHQSADNLDSAGMADQVGVMPIPGLLPGQERTENGGFYFAVGASSPVREEATQLALWLGGREVSRQRAALGVLPIWPDDEAALPPGSVIRAVMALVPSLVSAAASSSDRVLTPELLIAMDAVIAEELSAEEAVARFGEARAAALASSSPEPVRLPPLPLRARLELDLHAGLAAAALWGIAGLGAVGLVVFARRRGGVFRSLAVKLASMTGVVVLLALVTISSLLLHRSVEVTRLNLAERDRVLTERLGEAALSAGRHMALAVVSAPDGARSELTAIRLLSESRMDQDLLFVQILDQRGDVLMDDNSLLQQGWPELPIASSPRPDALARAVAQEPVARIRPVPSEPACAPGACELGRIEVYLPLFGASAGGTFPPGVARSLRLGFSVESLQQELDGLLMEERRRFAELQRLAAFATGLLAALSALSLALIARLSTRPLIQLREQAARVGAGDLEASVVTVGVDEVADLGRAFNRMVDGLRQRELVERTFKRFVAPSVVEALVAEGELAIPRSELKEVAVFFSDIEGFTTMAEALAPETLSRLLNDYLGAMTAIIHAEGGTVDKYMGDAVVAFWGAPLPQPDAAARALRAALAQQEAISRLAPSWRAEGHTLRVRMGIHCGPATVGSFGSPERMDYTAMGDTVNLASRLEGVNKLYGTRILVSREAVVRAGPGFYTRELDEVEVKGRGEAVRVFELRASAGGHPGYPEALGSWRRGDFQTVVGVLDGASADEPALRLLERARLLLERPPGDGWRPIRTLTEK